MIEAFYSGRAGIKSNQNTLDVISNNISNVNTTAYKTKDSGFSSLLSVSEVRPETPNSANLLAGSGSKADSVKTDYSQGSLEETDKSTDFYINSDSGFFAVKDKSGKEYYTKDGSFQIMKTANGLVLGTSDGMAVLDKSGNAIKISKAGKASAEPGVYTFKNTDGLLSAGDSLYVSTNVSGNAAATNMKPEQGMLENSNVDLATEMVGLITSQRGYQMSSSVVSTANQVESMINEIGQS